LRGLDKAQPLSHRAAAVSVSACILGSSPQAVCRPPSGRFRQDFDPPCTPHAQCIPSKAGQGLRNTWSGHSQTLATVHVHDAALMQARLLQTPAICVCECSHNSTAWQVPFGGLRASAQQPQAHRARAGATGTQGARSCHRAHAGAIGTQGVRRCHRHTHRGCM